MSRDKDKEFLDLVDGAMQALVADMQEERADISPQLAPALSSGVMAVIEGYLIGRRDGMAFVERTFRNRP